MKSMSDEILVLLTSGWKKSHIIWKVAVPGIINAIEQQIVIFDSKKVQLNQEFSFA